MAPLPLSAGISLRVAALETAPLAGTPEACDPDRIRPRSRDDARRLAAGVRLAARACARRLLADLGSRQTEVGTGPWGQPLWPAGFAGSISHTGDCVVVGVCPTAWRRSIGIDLERIPSPQAMRAVASRCLSPAEARRLTAVGAAGDVAAVLALCAKEALYKCLAAIAGHPFDPLDAEILAFDPVRGSMRLQLPAGLRREFQRGDGFDVALRSSRTHVFAAAELDP